MNEIILDDRVTDLSLPNGGKVFLSCSSSVTVKQCVCDNLFTLHRFAKGNRVVNLGAGEYQIVVPANACGRCKMCVDANEATPIEVIRDLELVCIKSKTAPLDPPIKVWVMASWQEPDALPITVRFITLDGQTELNPDDYITTDGCC